jgi:predicted Rossmann-fold nucleotide-binding protein
VVDGEPVLPPFDDLPFEVYRARLYDYDELAARLPDDATRTLDERIGDWFRTSTAELPDAAVRALHDATIDVALARFVRGRRMVGVMGGHSTARGDDLYRRAAGLGRELTRGGWCVATGGGPGLMEAANLGAWFAPHDDGALAGALDLLAGSPPYEADPDAHRLVALEVRARWPNGGESLGVPTWVYLDEPTSAFATAIAKYFANSVRETGLLALARSGVVYTPGGAGTTQEIFTDAAQNSLSLYEVRSPLVFLGRRFFEEEQPELVGAVRRQAAAFGWDDLVAVCDEPHEAVDAIARSDPDRTGSAEVVRARSRRD